MQIQTILMGMHII